MKAAVIGLGNIGRVHRTLLEDMGHTVVVCDVLPERREGGYADWREMLAREHPDVVHVCTPHALHADMVAGCLAEGAHVLCEKPLCIRREEVARILQAERAAKGQLGVCLQNRYNPSSRAAKSLLTGKTIVSACAMHAWRRDAAYYAADAWRGTWRGEGGGVLINQALHTVDLMLWIAGMPQRLAAQTGQLALAQTIETEDTAMLRWTGEAVCTLYATTGCGADFAPVLLFALQDGTRVELAPDALRVNGADVPLRAPFPSCGKPCYGGSHRLLMEDFYRCIADGRRFSIDGKEGAKSVEVVLAAYESCGREIVV